MTKQVQQTLHGYNKGHELLASSDTLDSSDADLLVRLSDLSGTLSAEEEFRPYITIYPLPSGKYHVVAKTWLDEDAPRAGCVLTQSLLVPSEAWQEGEISLRALRRYFTKPSRNNASEFKNAAVAHDLPHAVYPQPSQEEMVSFVSKFFSEGIAPVVWFDARDPDAILDDIVDHIWPNLRAQFSACSFALQPRTLPNRSFDLLFSSSSLYSRFGKLPREHFIDRKDAVTRAASIEPWCSMYAKYLLESKISDADRAWDIYEELNSDRTAIRSLYMLNDLRKRIQTSPMAALGVMDILEVLSPDPKQGLPFKRELVEEALTISDSLPSEQALEHLHLISERLDHTPFLGVKDAAESALTSRVATGANADIQQSLLRLEQLLVSPEEEQRRRFSYRDSLVSALALSMKSDDSALRWLSDFPRSAVAILSLAPTLASDFVRQTRKNNTVLTWLRLLDETTACRVLASLVMEARSKDDISLFDDAFSSFPRSRVSHVLAHIPADQIVTGSAPLTLIAREIAPRAPDATRAWATNAAVWSAKLEDIVAATAPNSAAGLAELLGWSETQPLLGAGVLAAFIARAKLNGIPRWLWDGGDVSTKLASILVASLPNNQRAAEALLLIVNRYSVLPLEVVRASADLLAHDASADANLTTLQDVFFESAIRWLLRGELSMDCAELGLVDTKIEDLYSRINIHHLTDVVADECRGSADTWIQAWRWVESLSMQLLARGNTAYELVRTLCRQAYTHWPNEVAACWVSILKRCFDALDRRPKLRLVAQALEFSFRYTSLPLGEVVATAFPYAYEIAIEDPESIFVDELDRLVGYSDWDRGKKLRGSLVDKFMQSDWLPGDLAVACVATFGLRKMFKRIDRKHRGQDYLAKILRDLSSREREEERLIAKELYGLLRNPHFHEPWV